MTAVKKKKVALKKKEKIAIVMSGGGMQCVYGAGVITALAERYNITEPDILIAASGSAATAVYYLTKQYQKIALLWLSLSQDKKFISMYKNPVVDIDYLIDGVMKKLHPFNLKKLARIKTKMFFPVVRAHDGKLVFLKGPPSKEIYEDVRATLAAPVIYGKKVKVHGRYYMDGAFGPTIHDYMKRAVEEGATTIFLIANRTDGYSGLTREFLKVVTMKGNPLKQDKGFIKSAKKVLGNTYIFVPPKGVNVITFTPGVKSAVSFLGGTKFNYRKMFNLGYKHAEEHPEMEEFRATHV